MRLPLRQAQGRFSGTSECQGGEAGTERRGLARRRGVGGRRTVACVHSAGPMCPVFCCFLPNVSSLVRNVSSLAGYVSNPWRRGGAEGESPRGSRSNRERAESGGAGESEAVVATSDVFTRSGRCVQFFAECVHFFARCVQFGGPCVQFSAPRISLGSAVLDAEDGSLRSEWERRSNQMPDGDVYE